MTNKPLPLGDISINFVAAILRTINTLGFDSKQIAKKYRIQSNFIESPYARVSIPKFMRIGHDAISLTSTPHLGLMMGSHTQVGDFGLPGFAAMTAPTLGKALSTLIEFEQLNSQNSRGRSKVYFEQQRMVCEFYSVSPYNQFNYFVVDSTLSSWFHFGSWLTDNEDWLHHIDIEHDMDLYRDQYEQILGCPVYFGTNRNAIILKKNAMLTRNRFENLGSHYAASQICLNQTKAIQRGKSITDQTVDLISEHLSGSTPSIQDIGEKMGMAGWTLRRKLEAEGASFKEILDSTRHSLALTYVRDTPHNFSEIAFLLGFSSPSAFQRAFKRWTSLTPGQFRSKHQK